MAVPPQIRAGGQEIFTADKGIKRDTQAGCILCNNRRACRPLPSPAAYENEQQIQADIQTCGDTQKNQRNGRISHGPQQSGKKIVKESSSHAGKYNP